MKPNDKKSNKSEMVADMIRALMNVEIGNLEDEKELELLKFYSAIVINKVLEIKPKYAMFEFHYVIILVGGYIVEGFIDIKKLEGEDQSQVVDLHFIKPKLLSKKDRLKTEPNIIEIRLFCILSKKSQQRALNRRFGIGIYTN